MQDQLEAEALYDLLERDVVPTFYERGVERLPRRWIDRMKASIGILCHNFNTHRMVREYVETYYLPAHQRYANLAEDNGARARTLAAWVGRVRQSWPQVRVESVENHSPLSLPVGAPVHARVRVHLGALTPDDVAVELYQGRLNADNEIVNALATSMQPAGPAEGGSYVFEAEPVACKDSGLHGFTVRVLPYHPDLPSAFLPGLICWA
jgi:starch phosphorylase